MGIEYRIVLDSGAELELIIEKIFLSLKSNELYQGIMLKNGMLFLPDNQFEQGSWFELSSFRENELYIWMLGNRMAQEEDGLVEEICRIISNMGFKYELDEP